MIINDKYKVESDTNNITLLEARKITGASRGRPTTKPIGEVYWTPVAYYSDMKELLAGLVRREIKGTGLTDLETVDKKFDELTVLINNLKIPSELSK